MNLKDCQEFKALSMYRPECCRVCVAHSCKDRDFDYNLARPGERARRVMVADKDNAFASQQNAS